MKALIFELEKDRRKETPQYSGFFLRCIYKVLFLLEIESASIAILCRSVLFLKLWLDRAMTIKALYSLKECLQDFMLITIPQTLY